MMKAGGVFLVLGFLQAAFGATNNIPGPETDLLAPALRDISLLQTKSATAKLVMDGGRPSGLELALEASDDYPGVELPCPPGGWDLSSCTGLEAEVENLGADRMVPVLQAANRGSGLANGTGVELAPGQSGIIRLQFGEDWGQPAAKLMLGAIDGLKVFVGPGQKGILRIKSIRAIPGAGTAPKKKVSSAPIDKPVSRQFLHFRPPGARFGDPMPVWRDGVYHVFYLKKTPPSEDLVWAHVTSRDLLFWEEHPDLPMRGCTGCFIVQDGTGYAFTGNSRADRWISRDSEMKTWEKDPAGVSVQLDPRWYDLKGWRDPSVVWVPEDKKYWMVAAARTTATNASKNGCVSLATSPDLVNWRVEAPLWSPEAWTWAECPDLFPLGNRWALVYLHEGTQLRLADSPRGPWPRPRRETLDKSLIAGRTLFDGKRRLIFGWLYDNGWGGDMLVPREIYLGKDGTAASRCAEEVVTACRKAPDATGGKGGEVFQTLQGSWKTTPASATAEGLPGQSALAVWPEAPDNFYLEAKLRIAPGARAVFVLRGKKENLEEAPVAVLLDPDMATAAFSSWGLWGSCVPRSAESTARHEFSKDGEVFVQMLLRGEILEVFFDQQHSLSTRVPRGKGALGLFAREGPVSWKDLLIRKVD